MRDPKGFMVAPEKYKFIEGIDDIVTQYNRHIERLNQGERFVLTSFGHDLEDSWFNAKFPLDLKTHNGSYNFTKSIIDLAKKHKLKIEYVGPSQYGTHLVEYNRSLEPKLVAFKIDALLTHHEINVMVNTLSQYGHVELAVKLLKSKKEQP